MVDTATVWASMAYTPDQMKDFKWKDVRITKVAITKSYLEGTGKIPTVEQMDEAMKLIYTQTDGDKNIITQLVQGGDKPFDPDEPPF